MGLITIRWGDEVVTKKEGRISAVFAWKEGGCEMAEMANRFNIDFCRNKNYF